MLAIAFATYLIVHLTHSPKHFYPPLYCLASASLYPTPVVSSAYDPESSHIVLHCTWVAAAARNADSFLLLLFQLISRKLSLILLLSAIFRDVSAKRVIKGPATLSRKSQPRVEKLKKSPHLLVQGIFPHDDGSICHVWQLQIRMPLWWSTVQWAPWCPAQATYMDGLLAAWSQSETVNFNGDIPSRIVTDFTCPFSVAHVFKGHLFSWDRYGIYFPRCQDLRVGIFALGYIFCDNNSWRRVPLVCLKSYGLGIHGLLSTQHLLSFKLFAGILQVSWILLTRLLAASVNSPPLLIQTISKI
jgi:hypothetical protein